MEWTFLDHFRCGYTTNCFVYVFLNVKKALFFNKAFLLTNYDYTIVFIPKPISSTPLHR